MQEMVYFKAIQKSAPMSVSVSGTTDPKTYLKKFRGGFSPLSSRWIRLWGERGAVPGHPRQGGIPRVKLQKFKCCNLMSFPIGSLLIHAEWTGADTGEDARDASPPPDPKRC